MGEQRKLLKVDGIRRFMKLFSGADLIIYFFIYGLLAWILNTVIYSLKEQRYINTGALNVPILGCSALIMILMIIVSSGRNVSYYGMLMMAFIDYFILDKVGLFFSQRLLLTKEISYERLGYGKSLKIRFINAIVVVGICFICLKTLQPIIFSLVSLIPRIIVNITALLLVLLLVVYIVLTYIFVRKYSMQNIEEDMSRRKKSFGEWISKNIWKRIYKLYPSLLSDDFEDSSKGISDADKLLEEQGIIFAKGINLAKLIWVLFISSLIGDIVETVYVLIVGHQFMRRSSFVLGPFSLVWVLGAVILTLALSKVRKQNTLSIFLSGFFFGGVFEYLCSVFTEVFFGMKFWDYSYMPFNIDGRTNLLFMFFWGIVALIWFKFIYPPFSKFIEKIPPVTGSVLAVFISLFFICNGIVTSMVMIRTTDRKNHPEARNVIEQFIDEEYPNGVVKKLWPNMDFLED